MLKKILLTSCLMFTSIASHAAVISHYGYERDSSSNIVKGGGLEWLKWDVTVGLSVPAALEAYKGWTLATSEQIYGLFNTFEFGRKDWTNQSILINDDWEFSTWNYSEAGSHRAFIELFGTTLSQPICTTSFVSCFVSNDIYLYSGAWFGTPGHVDYFRYASVADDATYYNDLSKRLTWSHSAKLSGLHLHTAYNYWSHGVALVRVANLNPAPVSSPESISLFALGLAVLGLRRRQSLDRLTS